MNAWKLVRYLFDHGFVYQHIYADKDQSLILDRNRDYIIYPDNLTAAKEFVIKYGDQAIKNSVLPSGD
ncbi:MAG: hypothetical protein ABIX36_11490 [Mucilaginibacter sp.]